MKTKSLLLLAALALLIATTGCIFSPDENDPVDDGDVDPVLQFADTREKLMENFRTVYEEMDYPGYRDMLHPDYIMLLQDATQNDFPDVGETLDLAEDLKMAENMFNTVPGVNAKGEWEAPISSIEMEILDKKTAWKTTLANDVIPLADAALFDVKFMLFRPGFTTFQIEGTLQFYVVRQDSLHNGVMQDYWRMIGQQDFTGAK